MISIIINDLAHNRIKELSIEMTTNFLNSPANQNKRNLHDEIQSFIEQAIIQTVIKSVIDERFGFKHIVVERDDWLNSFIKTQIPHIKRGIFEEISRWN